MDILQILLDFVIGFFIVLYYFKLKHIDTRFKEYDQTLKFYKGMGNDYAAWKVESDNQRKKLTQDFDIQVKRYLDIETKLQKEITDKTDNEQLARDVLDQYIATTDIVITIFSLIRRNLGRQGEKDNSWLSTGITIREITKILDDVEPFFTRIKGTITSIKRRTK